MVTNLEEYLRPNPYLRPPQPTPEFWMPPGESRGERPVPLRGRGSSHGHIVLGEFRLDFESRLERHVALAFRARPDTKDLVEQTPRVLYRDDDGVVREHIFDLLVTAWNGMKTAVFVKPSALWRPSMKRMLELIAAQISPQVANRVLPFTEKKLSRADRHNAELIQEYCRQPDADDDAAIAQLIAAMTGPTAIKDLVEDSGLNGYGYRAVVRAIAAGAVRLTKPGMINHSALIERTRS